MTVIEPHWVPEDVVLSFHRQQLAAHGGGEGVRDIGLLQSALARPMNAFFYNQVVSLSKLAACYAYGIAKNHAFIDGNKRTAYVVARAFLLANGFDIEASKEEKYEAVYRLAAGQSSEEQFAAWLEAKLVAKP